MKKEKGKINIPSLNRLGSVMAQNAIDDGLKNLKEDWENREVDSKDPNCEIVYGVADGKVYGYAIQKDFDGYKQLAAYMRQLEGDGTSHDSWLGKPKWILPRAIEIDLTARGYPLQEIIESGNTKEIDHYVEDNCPELKTTKLYLKALK